MAALFGVAAPLASHCPHGTREAIFACTTRPTGLLYMDNFRQWRN